MSPIPLTDLRDAARGLRRAPAIALSAITCLALGLAVTADVFSAVSRVLLQPLPFRDSEQLVTLYRTTPHFDTGPHSAGNFEDLARDTRRVLGVSATQSSGAFLEIGTEPMRVQAQLVSGAFFATLGVQPLMGRLLAPADVAPGAAAAVVITEELWRTQLGADPRVLGTTLPVDGTAHTVVGVLPRDFRVPTGFHGIL